jgi:preprotein translocase subunit SecA
LHQAVEAQQELDITFETNQAARITVQNFVLGYEKLGGMTGTGSPSAREIEKIYRLGVLPIPTHRPPRSSSILVCAKRSG